MPSLSFQPDPSLLYLIKRIPQLDPSKPFVRTWFLQHDLLQSLYAHYLEKSPYIRFDEEK
jgi:hypothetical protein